MLIENEFKVSAPPDQLWAHLLDVEKVAPCLPGARLTETIDPTSWRGSVAVKMGPVALSFKGTVVMDSRDDVVHRMVLKAQGSEERGKGTASALVNTWLEPVADGTDMTTVKISADITLTGPIAQMSRGMIPSIAAKLTKEFADCLEKQMG